jgi:hypothetical protein
MKNSLNILVDNATKPTSKTNKYGESTVAWAAWWGKVTPRPCKAGIIYMKYEGPNKSFYEGIIRGLEGCMWMVEEGDIVNVAGDCKLVIDQLNAGQSTGDMEIYFNQVMSLKRKLKGEVFFHYLSEENLHYKKVDQLAKRSRDFFQKNLK